MTVSPAGITHEGGGIGETVTMGKEKVWAYVCERCGHRWVPRKDETPRICPKCKSAYWDVPRQPKTTKK